MLVLPCAALILFESGPDSLTLSGQEWTNNHYIANVVSTLEHDPKQFGYALSGTLPGYVVTRALGSSKLMVFLPENIRAKAAERLNNIPVIPLVWYWIWVLVFSGFMLMATQSI